MLDQVGMCVCWIKSVCVCMCASVCVLNQKDVGTSDYSDNAPTPTHVPHYTL